jgi:hypothetical protein
MVNLLSDPANIQRTQHLGLYRHAFGEYLIEAESAIDFGAGDNDYNRHAESTGQLFTRVDSDYSRKPPKGDNYVSADCRKRIPEIPDDSYAVSVASFLLQHFPDEDMKLILEQMVRVTRTAEVPVTAYEGMVMVFPVFRPRKLKEALQKFNTSLFVQDVNVLDDDRPFEYPTLFLFKTDKTVDTLPSAIDAVVDSGALRKSVPLRTKTNVGKLLTAMHVTSKVKNY